MKAVFLTRYGNPEEVLQLKEINKPAPEENEVLIKIKATAVNDYDWSMVRGKPFLYRLFFGIVKPKRPVPGMEFSGIIEAVGDKVTSYKVGNEVYGDTSDFNFGTFAEYFCINEKALTLKPSKMSFEEAAAIPHASMLALQGLVDAGNIKDNQEILINGAGGGVGTFALQIAKLHNARVTGVDSGEKLHKMTEIGFDQVVDYKKEDFTKTDRKYDLILDARTSRSVFDYGRVLKPNGIFVTVGGTIPRLLQILILKPLFSCFSKKQIKILALKANKDPDYINQLYEQGKIKCIIDGPYPLEKADRAIQYFGEAKHSGKVVISV